MTKVLNLALLGPLQVEIDNEPLIGLDSGKAQALLCYLAVNGRSHSRHALANLLWGELPESDARRNLRGVLLRLRQHVEPYLQISHQTVSVHPDAPVQVDTAVFQQAIRNGEKPGDGWQTAVELYRGEFLQEFYIRQAPEFDNWLQEQRLWFHNQAVAAHDAWATQLQMQHNFEHGIQIARQLLALEPTREASHRLLMQLLAQSGQRPAALLQFEQCQQLLIEELGVAVSAETAVLHEQIRSGEYDKVTRRQGDKMKEATLSPGHLVARSPCHPIALHRWSAYHPARAVFWSRTGVEATGHDAAPTAVAKRSHHRSPAQRQNLAAALLALGQMVAPSQQLPLDFYRFSGCALGQARGALAHPAHRDGPKRTRTMRSGIIYGCG
ncbi:MAG: hypothetical protein H6652_16620 [Ardenticatenaceae bacterium]|nr:hypothetical protein [Ardenticatenaceae bacterium]